MDLVEDKGTLTLDILGTQNYKLMKNHLSARKCSLRAHCTLLGLQRCSRQGCAPAAGRDVERRAKKGGALNVEFCVVINVNFERPQRFGIYAV